MKYETISTEEQQAMFTNRLRQLETEHLNHQMRIDELSASGDTSEETKNAIEASQKAQKVLDAAHAEVKKKLKPKAS